jgi:AraC-like DNA-binding protein
MTVSGLAPEMLMEAIRDARLDPCLLSARTTPSHLARLACGKVCLDFATVGPAMRFQGEMARTCYTLVFVLACPEKGRSFNFSFEHTDGYMGFFPPGGVVDAVTPEGYSNATLTVPVAEFHEALALHFPEVPEKMLQSGAALFIDPVEQIRLRGLLARIEGSLWDSPERLDDPLLRRRIERELLATFLDALRSGCAAPLKPLSSRIGGRFHRLRKAQEFLSDHQREPVHLDDLCLALGLTRRGVEKLFRDLLGISPMTYLRHQRLHGARRALLGMTPAPGAVKFAAREWGFVHQGRFSRDYRDLFGESPRETVLSRRRAF